MQRTCTCSKHLKIVHCQYWLLLQDCAKLFSCRIVPLNISLVLTNIPFEIPQTHTKFLSMLITMVVSSCSFYTYHFLFSCIEYQVLDSIQIAIYAGVSQLSSKQIYQSLSIFNFVAIYVNIENSLCNPVSGMSSSINYYMKIRVPQHLVFYHVMPWQPCGEHN